MIPYIRAFNSPSFAYRVAFVPLSQITKGGALKIIDRKSVTEKERGEFIKTLKRHVQGTLYHDKNASKEDRRQKKKIHPSPPIEEGADEEGAVPPPPPPAAAKVAESKWAQYRDDLTSQMEIEAYVECRVRPYVSYLEKRAPTMASRSNFCEALELLANTSGAILAVLDMSNWVAATVAVASVAMGLTSYFYIPAQLGATNSELSNCHNLLNWWDSLSLVQRKKPSVRLKCASTCEGAILTLCQARTGVSAALPGQNDDNEEEEE